MENYLFFIVIFVACLLVVVSHCFQITKVSLLRKKGIFPKKGMESEADVIRLLKLGERDAAVICYRLVHKTSLIKSEAGVKSIESEFN